MTTPHLKKSIDRSPLRLGFFLAALAVACFALMPFAHSAQTAEENNALLEDNPAEEDNALFDLSTGTENAAIGQAANNRNNRVIPFNFDTRCGCDVVNLQGELHIKFGHGEFFGVRQFGPVDLKLQKFRGTGKTTGRVYKAQRITIVGDVTAKKTRNWVWARRFHTPVSSHRCSEPASQSRPLPHKNNLLRT